MSLKLDRLAAVGGHGCAMYELAAMQEVAQALSQGIAKGDCETGHTEQRHAEHPKTDASPVSTTVSQQLEVDVSVSAIGNQPEQQGVSLSLSTAEVQVCQPTQGTPQTTTDGADAGNTLVLITPPVLLTEQPHGEEAAAPEADLLDLGAEDCALLPARP